MRYISSVYSNTDNTVDNDDEYDDDDMLMMIMVAEP